MMFNIPSVNEISGYIKKIQAQNQDIQNILNPLEKILHSINEVLSLANQFITQYEKAHWL